MFGLSSRTDSTVTGSNFREDRSSVFRFSYFSFCHIFSPLSLYFFLIPDCFSFTTMLFLLHFSRLPIYYLPLTILSKLTPAIKHEHW